MPFFKNEVKVVLATMKEDDFPGSKKNEVHPCLTSLQFLTELEHNGAASVLLIQEGK